MGIKSANLRKLLEETPEAYYWIGFLMSDGCFSNNRISFSLSVKDSESINYFRKFIEYSGRKRECGNYFGVSCMDTVVVSKIMNKFDIKERKTYNPPEHLPEKEDNLLLSLIIGFIDGDGSIRYQTGRKDCQLTIKLHSSWINILNEMLYIITKDNFIKSRINNAGYAFFNISNSMILKTLKRKAIELKLPIMNRKWEVIDLCSISKQEEAKAIEKKVIMLNNYGLHVDEICFILNCKYHRIAKILRKNNIKVKSGEESLYVW